MHAAGRLLSPCCSAVVLVLVAAAAPAGQAGPEGRPNIVFIYTDDQRHDALGCIEDPWVKTPNLDRLAARGVRFARAFVTLSICSPSRAACLTGRYGSANGVTTLGRPLAEGEKTFAHYLDEAGYRTGFVGKWHLKTAPRDCGFRFVSQFHSNGPFYGRTVIEKGEKKIVAGMIDDYVARRSIDFIEAAAADGAPFVLWMCTQLPHMNHQFDWNVRGETLNLYDAASMPVPATWDDDLADKPPYLGTARNRQQALKYGYDRPEAIRRHMLRYAAAVTEVDASIGRVLDAIHRRGLEKTTWVLMAGDNGWFLGEHGLTSKVLPYEESMRIPMIVAGPGVAPRVDRHLVLNIDLAATIVDLAGRPVPDHWHGRSLAPLVAGEEVAWRESVYYEAPTPSLGSRPLAAVRTARWKYIQTCEPGRGKVAFRELYDLESDPQETKNLAAVEGHQPEVKRLAAELRRLRDSVEEER